MINQNSRPRNMSQLDYLWTNYGGYQVGNTPSSTPQQNVILDELAVATMIKRATHGGIVYLEYRENPSDETQMQLIGKAIDGQVVAFCDMPKEVHVQSFTKRAVTSKDKDNGCTYPLNAPVLSIVLTNGKEFLVSLDSLDGVLKGAETKTTITEIIDGQVYTHVKVNKQALSVVELTESTYGIQAQLNISPDKTGVQLVKGDNGLKARIPLGETGKHIKFDRLSLNAYMALANKDDATVYFISDRPYIYVGTQKYGVDAVNGGISDLVYDKEEMTLKYTDVEGAIQTLYLGPASEADNGMLSKTDYAELQKLRSALDGIVNVKEYIDNKVNNLGTSIEYGSIQNNRRPLHLKNSKGDILSTVWTEVETYLANSMTKLANANDVIDAEKVGVSLEEGDKIIILTLTNGDKHFIKLQDLVIAQSFKNSNTILFSDNNGVIAANLKLSDNKILYVTENGLAANIQIKRDNGYINIYGQSMTETHLLGRFKSPQKELISGMFISNITEDHITNYPPSQVNWKSDEAIVLGNDYYVLMYQDYESNNISNYYISIAKPTVRIANIEGNKLKSTEDGSLYVLFEWEN